jgi:hypothetical protein
MNISFARSYFQQQLKRSTQRSFPSRHFSSIKIQSNYTRAIAINRFPFVSNCTNQLNNNHGSKFSQHLFSTVADNKPESVDKATVQEKTAQHRVSLRRVIELAKPEWKNIAVSIGTNCVLL